MGITFESVNEIIKREHLNGSSGAVFFYGTVTFSFSFQLQISVNFRIGTTLYGLRSKIKA